jgi:hypothetical protein
MTDDPNLPKCHFGPPIAKFAGAEPGSIRPACSQSRMLVSPLNAAIVVASVEPSLKLKK